MQDEVADIWGMREGGRMRAYKKMMDMEVDPLEAPRELRAGREEGAYLIAHAAHWLWRLGLAVKSTPTLCQTFGIMKHLVEFVDSLEQFQ